MWAAVLRPGFPEKLLSSGCPCFQGIARRVRQAVERFADTGAGNVKRLQGIDPPEYRLRVGDYRVRFHQEGETIHILRVRHRREGLSVKDNGFPYGECLV